MESLKRLNSIDLIRLSSCYNFSKKGHRNNFPSRHVYTHKRESVRFFEQTICSARRIDHSTCLEASPIRIFDAIPTFSRLFEATIKVSNGTSGDDLRLETGLRSLLTTPQRDGEAANCIPISLTRILSCLRTSTWVKRSLIPPLLESLRIRFRFSSIFHSLSLSLLSVVREYRYRRTGYGIWRLLEIIIFRGTAKTGDSRKSRIKIYNRVGRERGEEARSRRNRWKIYCIYLSMKFLSM